MCIRNRIVSMIFKILVALVALLGVVMNAGLLGGQFDQRYLYYYGTVCNFVAFLYFLIAALITARKIAVKGKKGTTVPAHHFKGGLTIALIAIIPIQLFLLSGTLRSDNVGGGLAASLVSLFLVPCLALLDWALFDRKGRYSSTDPFFWLVFPLGYYVLTIGLSLMGITFLRSERYPYYFMNPDLVSWGWVLINLVVVSAGFVVLGYVYYFIDYILGRTAKKRLEKAKARERAAQQQTASQQPAPPVQYAPIQNPPDNSEPPQS